MTAPLAALALTGLAFLPGKVKAVQPGSLSPRTAPLAVVVENQTFTADPVVVASWIRSVTVANPGALLQQPTKLSDQVAVATGSGAPRTVTQTFYYHPGRIYAYVKGLSGQLDRPAREPKLTVENNRVTEFVAAEDGRTLDRVAAVGDILTALNQSVATITLPVATSSPKQTLAATNNLGIRELVARGESSFRGSPKNRRHNIRVGVSKMRGVIIAPGEEFSFNKYLGPVEADQGFLPELVIKRTGTVPELGGGLCQVSSTTFRAAVNAGLPITQRKNHAYAVQYYAPQGTDATIYPGVVDLKFKNDTPGHLLVWPYFKDDDTLVFDLYGTKDDRMVTLKKPVQYDRKPDGSLKASWTREVSRNGTTTVDIFKSVYLSPALFHKEEQFVASTTPTTSQGQPEVPAQGSPTTS